MNELTIPGEITRTSLTLPPGMPYEKWEEVIEYLGLLVHGSRFWLGDAIEYGEHSYNQKYAQALDLTGLSYGRLSNITYTCRRVTSSRRREGLSFEHHTVVAPLPPDEQTEWLAKAEREGWDSNELRDELRKDRGFSPLASYTEELENANGRLKSDLRQAHARVEALEEELADDPYSPVDEAFERDSAEEGQTIRVICRECGTINEVIL